MDSECSLIIGANGFIGSSLSRHLAPRGNLYTISRSPKSSNIDSTHFTLDIENISEFRKILMNLSSNNQKINAFYLVGPISDDRSIKNPVDLSLRNPREVLDRSITNLVEVIDLLREFNSKFLFVSTGAIYDSRNAYFFSEGDSLFPPSPYAALKYSSEGIALSYFESYGIDVRIARIFSVYGEEMDRFFIFDIIKKFLSADAKIVLKGSGVQERDYLHVSDVAYGLATIMDKGNAGEIYNLSSGIPSKLSDLTEEIKSFLHLENIDIIWNKEETKGVRDIWYGNNDKIKSLGFKLDNTDRSKLNATVNAIKDRILA